MIAVEADVINRSLLTSQVSYLKGAGPGPGGIAAEIFFYPGFQGSQQDHGRFNELRIMLCPVDGSMQDNFFRMRRIACRHGPRQGVRAVRRIRKCCNRSVSDSPVKQFFSAAPGVPVSFRRPPRYTGC